MKVHIAYGKNGLDIDVPEKNLVKILQQAGAPPLADPERELRRQLEHPIDSPPLATLAHRATSACVVISDITRPVPNTTLLPPILQTLEHAGIAPDRIHILIATGLHRPSTPSERRMLLGDAIPGHFPVTDHHARDRTAQRFLGITPRSTPVFIDEIYCQADLKITTGFIEPHLMAGFSGGCKLVAPGCAGEETIKALHSPRFLEDARCREGCIDGNPLHDELLRIAGMAGHDFIVNVSLDADHRITGMFVGHPVTAHDIGVRHVRNTVSATIQQPVDIVVTTSAGFPLDLTYYQAVKGMTAALPVVREGGTLIVAAECAEGLGSREFSEMATRYRSAASFVEAILRDPVAIDQWQLEESAKAARKADVVVVADGIPAQQKDKLFVNASPSVERALQSAFAKHGPDATLAIIPHGPYTLVDVAPT